ncbi:SAM-dependent methyltransferase [Herpetosiphon geysericola]|uniref:Phytanoyl-CoA dioxygenase n=1 Tax=Herpetosiphon geysericola TaxID=70996 RepID=A0A0N8GTG4_9CHLR|nr:hypothetical protein [Herpetosiphon geysericola]KPL92026.1 hypothetical protein SE18_00295 [Herpetosiphon geysericola]
MAHSASLSAFEELAELTSQMLDRNGSYLQWQQAIERYFSICVKIVGHGEVAIETSIHRDTPSPYGRMISPRNAGRCLHDFLRTTRFLQGVYAAIQELQQRFPNQCLRVLYAGSGPFAPLALPLMTVFKPTEVQFWVLDYHQSTLDSVRQIAAHFQVEDSIQAFIQADATQFTPDESYHLVVTETMQKGLANEPQVAITAHLLRSLLPDGLLVPERITVNAILVNLAKEFDFNSDNATPQRQRIELGPIFTVDQATMSGYSVTYPEPLTFPAITVSIPPITTDMRSLALQTQIQTYGDIRLDDYESGLTYLTAIDHIQMLPHGGTLTFQYILDDQPRFLWELATRPITLDRIVIDA